MHVLGQPHFKILARNHKGNAFGECFDSNRGLFHTCNNGYLADKIHGFILLYHKDIAIFKLIDNSVVTVHNDTKIIQGIVLLVNNIPRRKGANRITL